MSASQCGKRLAFPSRPPDQATPSGAACPGCGACPTGVHGSYLRFLADVPSAGRSVVLQLRVRRFRAPRPASSNRRARRRRRSWAWTPASTSPTPHRPPPAPTWHPAVPTPLNRRLRPGTRSGGAGLGPGPESDCGQRQLAVLL
ncbi:transposase family protein [Streptomyces sp. NPDC056224]|uniref:transposase family protein n=1 Tax=Streptomyces sp. NPDC056224 TaxID=3345750 RepID=UPI0035E05147